MSLIIVNMSIHTLEGEFQNKNYLPLIRLCEQKCVICILLSKNVKEEIYCRYLMTYNLWNVFSIISNLRILKYLDFY